MNEVQSALRSRTGYLVEILDILITEDKTGKVYLPNKIPKCIEAGCYREAVQLELSAGSVLVFLHKGRIIVMIGTCFGNCILIDKSHEYGNEAVVGCFPKEIEKLYGILVMGNLDTRVISAIVGNSVSNNIGSNLESITEAQL